MDDLVKRLREKRERFHDLSGVYWSEDMLCQEAADRIEADAKRVADLEALLKEACDDLASHAENEYPKRLRDIYPSMARSYEREMDLPRRIDALIDKEKKDG